MTIETTINGGLPVVASGDVQVWKEDIGVPVFTISFRRGGLVKGEISDADHDRIINELIEAQEEEWAREEVKG